MRIFKYLLLLLLFSQIPFLYNLYRSYQLEKYLLNIPRQAVPPVPFRDLRGAIHVHSAAGSHSLGTYPEIIEVAKELKFQYIMMTEHPKDIRLFNELTDPDVVMIYGWEEERPDGGRNLRDPESRVKVFSLFEGLGIPEDVTGVEVFSIFESAKAASNAFSWINWVYHQFGYEEFFFFHLWELNDANFRLWDNASKQRPLAAFGGNDAHQNVGLVLQTTAGQRLVSLMVDPYRLSLNFVTNHLLLDSSVEVDAGTVVEALRMGRSYIAFEELGDPTGFTFHAVQGGEVFGMGSTVQLGAELFFQSPLPARFELIRGGEVVLELEGTRFQQSAEVAGTYRLEVSLLNPPGLIEGKPWIISNPIYVK